MAYRASHLTIRVEILGAEWVMGQADKALAKVAGLVASLRLRPGDSMPAEAYALFPEVFIEGLRAWTGVEGPDGTPLPFTSANVREIPTEDKIAVVGAYLQRRDELEEKKGSPAAPPTEPTVAPESPIPPPSSASSEDLPTVSP